MMRLKEIQVYVVFYVQSNSSIFRASRRSNEIPSGWVFV